METDTGSTMVIPGGWTARERGVITSIEPHFGQFGTRITLKGSSILGGYPGPFFNRTVVTIGGIRASSLVGDPLADGSSLIFRAGAHLGGGTAANSTISVESAGGAVVSSTPTFSYLTQGSISSVTPSEGGEGTLVTIRGMNLRGHDPILSAPLASVHLGNFPAIVKSQNDSTIVVVATKAPNSSQPQNVRIEASSGAIVEAPGLWTQLPPPVISKVSPSFGQGGTRVTIDGQNIMCGGSHITEAYMDGTEVLEIISSSNSKVVVRPGSSKESSSPGTILLVADSGAVAELSSAWTYVTPGKIDSVRPAQGQEGTEVVITGSKLFGAGFFLDNTEHVSLNGVLVEKVLGATQTKILVKAGPKPDSDGISAGDVRVVSETGAVSIASEAFTYLKQSVITGISPNQGQVNTRCVITGSRMRGGGDFIESVDIGGFPLRIVLESDSLVVVDILDNHDIGTFSLTLTSSSGARSTLPNAFTFVPRGLIHKISPNHGRVGTQFAISGTGLLGGGDFITSITLKGYFAVFKAENTNNSYISAVATTGVEGVGDVIITSNTGSTVTLKNGFTYEPHGEIFKISPSSGQQGTKVTIAGSDLLGGGNTIESVRLCGVQVEMVLPGSSDSQIIVIAASSVLHGTPGSVVITADTGATHTAENAFRYLKESLVDGVVPTSGQHGTFVRISGSNLFGGGSKLSQVLSKDKTTLTIVIDNPDGNTVGAQPTIYIRSKCKSPEKVCIISESGAYVSSTTFSVGSTGDWGTGHKVAIFYYVFPLILFAVITIVAIYVFIKHKNAVDAENKSAVMFPSGKDQPWVKPPAMSAMRPHLDPFVNMPDVKKVGENEQDIFTPRAAPGVYPQQSDTEGASAQPSQPSQPQLKRRGSLPRLNSQGAVPTRESKDPFAGGSTKQQFLPSMSRQGSIGAFPPMKRASLNAISAFNRGAGMRPPPPRGPPPRMFRPPGMRPPGSRPPSMQFRQPMMSPMRPPAPPPSLRPTGPPMGSTQMAEGGDRRILCALNLFHVRRQRCIRIKHTELNYLTHNGEQIVYTGLYNVVFKTPHLSQTGINSSRMCPREQQEMQISISKHEIAKDHFQPYQLKQNEKNDQVYISLTVYNYELTGTKLAPPQKKKLMLTMQYWCWEPSAFNTWILWVNMQWVIIT
eukprot:UC4_evm6s754